MVLELMKDYLIGVGAIVVYELIYFAAKRRK